MAYLDNSGNIILDAVLTDHGRKVLAQADGSFSITKFGLADDEIDYTLYDKNHPSGSSYYDLEILQTPILEAFTDNAAQMHYNLVTYSNLEYLFLPVVLLNETEPQHKRDETLNSFVVCADGETWNNNGSTTTFSAVGVKAVGNTYEQRVGFLNGANPSEGGNFIRTDEGLNTTQISPGVNLQPELFEETYTVKMDNRLLTLCTSNGSPVAFDFVDDDEIASYTVTKSLGFVSQIMDKSIGASTPIPGPRGSRVDFKLQASLNAQTSTYLFLQLGGEATMPNRASPAVDVSVYYIDTTVTLVGMTTGATIHIPVRLVKLK